MKKNIFIIIIAVSGLALLFSGIASGKTEPVIITASSSLIRYTTDDLIKKSELIVIGEVKTTLPSQWKDINGNGSRKASSNDITRAHGLFTDSLFSVTQTLKGDKTKSVVRIRSFSGEIENIRWVDEDSPSFAINKTYLLFLAKDTGATATVDPGDYVTRGAIQGMYEIVDGKAISVSDQWILEDLIAYIQNPLSGKKPLTAPTALPTPTLFLQP